MEVPRIYRLSHMNLAGKVARCARMWKGENGDGDGVSILGGKVAQGCRCLKPGGVFLKNLVSEPEGVQGEQSHCWLQRRVNRVMS